MLVMLDKSPRLLWFAGPVVGILQMWAVFYQTSVLLCQTAGVGHFPEIDAYFFFALIKCPGIIAIACVTFTCEFVAFCPAFEYIVEQNNNIVTNISNHFIYIP